MAEITSGVASGDVTPGEAAELSELAEAYIKALKASEFDQRLRAIEKKTMRRDLERSLRAVERRGSGGHGYWFCAGDGMVRNFSGDLLTREEIEARARAAGKFCYFASETDSRL